MNFIELKERYFNDLSGIYPREEISSIYNILTQAFLKMNRLQIALDPKLELSTKEEEQMIKALSRLKEGQPVQYIVGETEFFGLPFKVDKNVLIPRSETEELITWVIKEFPSGRALKILDIGTGSGCIAITLAKNMPQAEVYALDVSQEALRTAKENATLNKVEINFIQQDILRTENLSCTFDVIVSNPPYVRESEKEQMHDNVLKHEPELALYVKNENALLFYEKIAKLACEGLNINGQLFFEINQYLAMETEALMKKEGFETELRRDIFGNYRMLRANLRN